MLSKIKGNRWLLVLLLAYTAGNMSACISYKKRPRRLYHNVVAKHQTFDALIVPGVPFNGTRWDSTMKGRVLWSYILYKNGIVRNIIYSGAAVYTPYYEAKIMGLYAMALGIPETHIFYDTLAEHSTENVYYSYEIARQQGFKSIALGTDPFQSSLLKSFTRKRFKTAIQHLPFVIDSLQLYHHLEPEIDPASAKKEHFIALPDREGFWKRLEGTRGKNIPWGNKKRKAAPL
jgi:hypothetical protein